MHPLDGPFLKFRRAQNHLKVLDGMVKRFNGSNPNEIVGETVREGENRYYILRFKILKPFPADYGLDIGDICNNLRSALDHTLWQLWLLKDPMFDGRVTFPIFDERVGEHGFIREGVRNIRGLPLHQRTLIESLQPYNTGDTALSVLRDVNNTDKHRTISVVASVAHMRRLLLIGPASEGQIPKTVFFELRNMAKLEDNAIIAKIPIDVFQPGSQMRVQTHGIVNYVFDGSKTADGALISPALEDGIVAVRHALFTFEPEFSAYGESSYR